MLIPSGMELWISVTRSAGEEVKKSINLLNTRASPRNMSPGRTRQGNLFMDVRQVRTASTKLFPGSMRSLYSFFLETSTTVGLLLLEQTKIFPENSDTCDMSLSSSVSPLTSTRVLSGLPNLVPFPPAIIITLFSIVEGPPCIFSKYHTLCHNIYVLGDNEAISQFGELRMRLRGSNDRPLEPDPGNAGGGNEMCITSVFRRVIGLAIWISSRLFAGGVFIAFQ